MTVLLVAEHDNASVSPATAKALSAALQVGDTVNVLVAGQGCKPAAEAAAKLEGAAKVLVADAPHLANQLAEEEAALLSRWRATMRRSWRRRRRRARTSCRALPRCST